MERYVPPRSSPSKASRRVHFGAHQHVNRTPILVQFDILWMSPVIRASLRAFSIPANFEELFRPVRTFAENQDHSNCNLPAYVALAHKAKLQSGAQAEDLRHTQAAEAARAARKKGSNRVVQKGGAIYVDKARHSSKVRERSEVEKAELALKRAKAAERNRFVRGWKAAAALAKQRNSRIQNRIRLLKKLHKELRARCG
jgi:hypothetical protein